MRRRVLLLLPLGGLLCRGDQASAAATLRGKLLQDVNSARLRLEDGREISLRGDKHVSAILLDERLKDATLEVAGDLAGDELMVGPIHTRSLFVLKDGKKQTVSYWCDVCAIRTYSPGVCMCCQEDTELQLRDDGDH
jgi:hypothetical protein